MRQWLYEWWQTLRVMLDRSLYRELRSAVYRPSRKEVK